MRKLTLLIILTFVKLTTLSSQNISIGGEFGVVSSINSDYNIADFENRRNSYFGGVNFDLKIRDRLSFSTGIHYLKMGYRHSTCYVFEEGVKNQLTGKFDYVTIPISVNIKLLKSKKLITTFGFLLGYNTNATQDYPEPKSGCKIYYIPDMTLYTQEFSLSGIVGVGYKIFESNRIELIPTLNYSQGLNNTYKVPSQDLNIVKKYRAMRLTVKINYKL